MRLTALRPGRLLATLALALSVAVAGCSSGSAPVVAALPDVAAPPKLAFEPVTGLPQDRTAVFATALGASAAERGLAVVGRDSDEAKFRLKGYVTAQIEGRETVLSYVWDIFAADGGRAHRLAGEERIPAALPDPWQAVTDAALEAIAIRTAEDIDAWVKRGAPFTPGPAAGTATPS